MSLDLVSVCNETKIMCCHVIKSFTDTIGLVKYFVAEQESEK
jgi:hypothetical protein